jgi:putative ABC transport system permease protein
MMRTFWAKWKAIFRKRSLDQDLDSELQYHLDMQIAENLQKGMPPGRARAEARRSFGGLEQVKELYRDQRAFPALESAILDVRFALRMMRRSPGFTAIAVLTMALGIGASTAVFSVVNAIVMRPLRFHEPQRLMVILSAEKGGARSFLSAQGVYVDWSERETSFESFAGVRSTSMILSGAEQAHQINVAATSYDFLHVIGVQPVMGRSFTREEDRTGQASVALLDAGFWRREFNSDPHILGRTLTLDDKPFTIIGIMPAGLRFAYFGATDVWIPMEANRGYRTGGDVIAIGRLGPGVTQEAAQTEMDAIMQQIRTEHEGDSKTYVVVKPLQEWIVGDVRRTFLVLLGAVSFVLLICCANIANLLLARTAARQREMAVRAALGAGRGRLVRQTLVESVTLSMIGGVIGAALAISIVRVVPSIRAFYIPRLEEIAVDQTMLLVAAIVAMGSGILFGLAPSFQVGRKELNVALHRGEAMPVHGIRLRNILVIAQLALAVVLLSGAGLMTNTLVRLLRIDLGFERDHVLAINTRLPYKKYDALHGMEFQRRLAAEIGRMPGIRAVSVTDYIPLQAVLFPYQLRVAHLGENRTCEALARNVDPNYLSVMGIPLLAGRNFENGDDQRVPVPILVNRSTAASLFGPEDPVGKIVLTNYGKRPRVEVIGVVGDVRQLGLTNDAGFQIYLPAVYGSAKYVVARTTLNPNDLFPAIRSAVRTLDRDVPAPEISTMDDWFSRQVAKPRFYLLLLTAFAAAGLILAAIGIYGVISYTVAQRTREFGIRMALGAERRDILQLVLEVGVRLIAAGAVIGIAGAAAGTQLISSLLYGVKPRDPLTMACVVVLLAGVALGACYLAARKATRTDPNVALRCD